MVGWILAGAGLVAVVLTAISTVRSRASSTTTHADGSRTVHESRQDHPPV